MTSEEQQVIERLQQATNILVTVSDNPSIDQLSACLGLTLALNKAGKHATAVFSGEVPSTLEFLQPEKTLEKNTDSLRDFIISLDKAKADKLRYKVEDDFVKIFITPYRTAISESDFEYSQGDFNIEVVIALGVRNQQDLDQAITSHGRILHDATVVSINTETGTELGTLNITEPSASSLSELVSLLAQNLGKDLLDSQIATALLTGIVAETERFSNEKTSPSTMSISSSLMAAGANQQLVATKLQEHTETTVVSEPKTDQVSDENDSVTAQKDADSTAESAPVKKAEPGTLEIAHETTSDDSKSEPEVEQDDVIGQIEVNEDGELTPFGQDALQANEDTGNKPTRMVLQPPTMQAGNFTANSEPENPKEDIDITLPSVDMATMSHEPTAVDAAMPKAKPFDLSEALANANAETEGSAPIDIITPSSSKPAYKEGETLAELEQDVDSPHLTAQSSVNIEADKQVEPSEERDISDARKAVEDAVAALPPESQPLEPIAALNAASIDLNVLPAPGDEATPPHQPVFETAAQPVVAAQPQFETMPTDSAADQPMAMPMPPSQPTVPFTQSPLFGQPPVAPVQPIAPVAQDTAIAFTPPAPFVAQPSNPNAPPPLPPPMMPPSFPQQ